MKLYLVRHGEAVPPEIDPEKTLSPQGREEIEHIAKMLAKKNFPIHTILHSNKARAKQTAEIMRRFLAPKLELEEHAHLAPNDPIEEVVARISDESEPLMIVGHLPFLEKLVGFLVGHDKALEPVNFKQGTTVCLEPSDSRWVIDWIVGLDQA